MKLFYRCRYLLLALLLLGVLVSCDFGGGGGTTTQTTTPPATTTTEPEVFYTVTVASGAYTVTPDSQQVSAGDTATFTLLPQTGYEITAVSAGTYNSVAGTLVVSDVQANITVTVTTVESQRLSFMFYDCTASVPSGLQYENTEITVSAKKGKALLGWTLGEPGTEYVSTDRNYTFTLTEAVSIYANYGPSTITYDANGGTVVGGTTSTTMLDTPDISFYTAPNSRWDNHTFRRTGYVLIGYNTEADGSGQAYGMGSKVTFAEDGHLTLYCMWAQETPASSFTFSSGTYTVGGLNGYAVTGYSGNDDTVVIPASHNGKPVVRLASGALQNKDFTTLVFSRNMREVQENAVTGCGSLITLYFPDSIWSIPDEAFDEITYSNFRNFYINATSAPRNTKWWDGSYRVKWDRMVTADKPRIVFLSGSSSIQGLSTPYLEALFDNQYTVVNYGTIRTSNMMLYMEAFQAILGEEDTLVFAPEHTSIYQMGASTLDYLRVGTATSNTFRDTEGVYNVYWHVDISNYTNVFDGFTHYSQWRYPMQELHYDWIFNTAANWVDRYGDFHAADKHTFSTSATPPSINVTFNHLTWDETNTADRADFRDYADLPVKLISELKENGTRVYFAFAPVHEDALNTAAKTTSAQNAFVELIEDLWEIETIGSIADHIFENEDMYKKDTHHLNDYGRVKHCFFLYQALAEVLGIEDPYTDSKAKGTDFAGCLWRD